jgi:hypothetical protein
VQGVNESTLFAPHVRGEIGAFGWHVISHLPATWEEGKQLFVNEQGGRHKFFNVWPYIKPLRKWIARQHRQKQQQQQQSSRGEAVPAAPAAPAAPPAAPLPPGHSMSRFKFNRQELMQHLSAVGL